MKKIGIFCLCICCMFSLLVVPSAATEETGQENKESGYHSVDATSARLGTGKIVDNVEAAFLYETHSDTLMYSYNADIPMDPAGFVKIMTGYVAAEKGIMSDRVTVTESAMNSISSASVVLDIQVGEVLTLEDLMHCLLVRSANEAAVIIAEHISGSQTAFVAEMNRMAKELGCTNTNFTNATGLYDEEQLSTARDIARIMEKALENEAFRRAFCAADYTVPKTNMSNERLLVTTNYLIYGNLGGVYYYIDNRVLGGRVSTTIYEKNMVAAVSQYGTMEMISIVMGSDHKISSSGYITTFGGYLETSALLNAGFANLKVAQVLYENQTITQLPVRYGDSDVILGPKESAFALIGENTTVSGLTFRYSNSGQELEAPIKKGDYISSLEIWSDGFCVAKTDLYAMNSVSRVEPVSEPITDSDINNRKFGTVLITIVIVIAVLIALLYVYRQISIIKARKRSQRNRQNRRRSR